MDQATSANPVVSEELRLLLKYYEMTALNSLGGPSSNRQKLIAEDDLTSSDLRYQWPSPLLPSAVRQSSSPICHPGPVMTPRDLSCDRMDTTIRGHVVSCFLVGGEKRLCFPQVLNSALREFDMSEINKACSELNIHCSHCSKQQLDNLKLIGVLPMSMATCNLITNTDTERLYNFLTQQRRDRQRRTANATARETVESWSTLDDVNNGKEALSIFVCHECFGHCKGRYFADKYASPSSSCVKCIECGEFLAPDKFILHSHRNHETRTCHWGFDVNNWRAYVHLPAETENVGECQAVLKAMKTRFVQPVSTKRSAANLKEDKLLSALLLPPLEKKARLEPVKIISQSTSPPQPSSADKLSASTNAAAVQLLLCDPLLLAYYNLLVNARVGQVLPLPYAVPQQPQTQTLVDKLCGSTSTCVSSVPAPLSVEEAAFALLKLAPQQQQTIQSKGTSSANQVNSKLVKTKCGENSTSSSSPLCGAESYKKHLLHQFSEEQKQLSSSSEADCTKTDAKTSSDADVEDLAHLELLLINYVKDMDGLRRICEKLRELRRSHETKLEVLNTQNRILHQEIAYLRNGRQHSMFASLATVGMP